MQELREDTATCRWFEGLNGRSLAFKQCLNGPVVSKGSWGNHGDISNPSLIGYLHILTWWSDQETRNSWFCWDRVKGKPWFQTQVSREPKDFLATSMSCGCCRCLRWKWMMTSWTNAEMFEKQHVWDGCFCVCLQGCLSSTWVYQQTFLIWNIKL